LSVSNSFYLLFDIVLDPYLGGGSTLITCKQLKRNYIGIDISKKYCEIARERLSKISSRLDFWW